MKPATPAIDVPGHTLYQKMDNLFRVVIAVPEAEIDRRERERQKQRGKNSQKRKKFCKS